MPTKAYIIVTVALCIVFADSVIKERGKDAITLLDNRPVGIALAALFWNDFHDFRIV